MNLIHHRGSLFDAPPDALLAHAVNCKGVWGYGIAKQFKERFPDEFKAYQLLCQVHKDALVGTARILSPRVAVLFCSRGYGKQKDSQEDILNYITYAARDLIWKGRGQAAEYSGPVHMPRICSGAFKVPWSSVEARLKSILELMPSLDSWHVWTP